MENVLSPDEIQGLRFDAQCGITIDALQRRLKSAGTCLEFSHDREDTAKTLLQIHEELLVVALACLKGAA